MKKRSKGEVSPVYTYKSGPNQSRGSFDFSTILQGFFNIWSLFHLCVIRSSNIPQRSWQRSETPISK